MVSPLIFASLAALFWLSLDSPRAPLDLFEDGHWLGIASDMLTGKAPYRETFPVHGFLADGGLDKPLFDAFEPSYALSVQAHNLLAALFHPALFLIAAYATRRPWVSLTAVVFSVGATTAVGADRPVLALLSLAVFLRALDKTAPAFPAFLAGLLAGLGFLYALDFGSFVIAGECVVLAVCIRQLWRRGSSPLRISAFVAGAGLVALFFGIYLCFHSALAAFYRVSFVDLPRHIGETWGVPFPWPGEVLRAWLYQVPLMAPFQSEVLRSLAEHPPRFVVLASGTWLDRIDRIPNADRIPDVWRWVSARYPRRVAVANVTIGLPEGNVSNRSSTGPE